MAQASENPLMGRKGLYKGQDGHMRQETVVKRGREVQILLCNSPGVPRRHRLAHASDRGETMRRIIRPQLGKEVGKESLASWVEACIELTYLHATKGRKENTINGTALRALFKNQPALH